MAPPSPLDAHAQAWRATRSGLELFALGARDNRSALDLEPFGLPATWCAAEEHPALCAQYLALNRLSFPRLPLARWAMSDLYLMPGAIVGFRGHSSWLPAEAREAIGAPEEAILAAWVGVPSVRPGERIGVSLMSFVPGLGAWAKAFGARVHRARSLRGVAQWASPSLRSHVRLGPLRVLGRVPGGHDLGDASFVYATDLDEAIWAAAMAKQLELPILQRVPIADSAALSALLDAADRGEPVRIVPPGLSQGCVTLG